MNSDTPEQATPPQRVKVRLSREGSSWRPLANAVGRGVITEVKLRKDPFGQDVETALMTHAPKFVHTRERIAKELKIPPSKPRHSTHSLEDVARVLDAIEHAHLFGYAILALNTWAAIPRARSREDCCQAGKENAL